MDIVYVVKPCRRNEELMYSLRSLVNIPHDKVFIVGGCPKNINQEKVIHIPTEQSGTKWRNSTNNLLTACSDERLSEDFILFNDDFYVLKPIKDLKELELDRGPLWKVYDYYHSKYGPTDYAEGIKQTGELLERLGVTNPLSYELHIPFVMAKSKVLKAFTLPGVMDIPVVHKRTLYGNLYKTDTKTVRDVKVYNFFDSAKTGAFLSSIDTFLPNVLNWLAAKFPQKSEYEL